MSKCIRIPTQLPFCGLEPTDYIPADALLSGDPQEQGKSYYADQTSQFDAGVWECEPNKHLMQSSPYDEFVYLLQGEVDITDDQGNTDSYVAGDSFVMPRGCSCTWDVKKAVRKLYVVLVADGYAE